MPRYTATVAHGLGREEARSRFEAAVDQARTGLDFQGEWKADTFDFSLRTQGLRVVGKVEVGEESLIFDGTLPLLAMPFKNWIPRALKKSLAPRSAPAITVETENAAPTVLFLHIPKAGGQALGEYIDAQTRAGTGGDGGDAIVSGGVAYLTYGFLKERPLAVPQPTIQLLGRGGLRSVIGHFWFGLHEHLARPAVYVTALRDPVERIVSLYFYAKLHESMSLEEFVEAPPFREVDNDQTRRLAGADPEIGECTPALLDTARENLRRHFAVVGTTERIDETVVLLERRLGWRGAAVCHPRNVTADRPAVAALPRHTVAAIRRRNELDYELWRYASEWMDDAIAAEGGSFARDLAQYRERQRREIPPS
jgi:hypothetical protein